MTAPRLNGSKPPAPVWVVCCPRCGERRALPERAPSVWGWKCRQCHAENEINLETWKRDDE